MRSLVAGALMVGVIAAGCSSGKSSSAAAPVTAAPVTAAPAVTAAAPAARSAPNNTVPLDTFATQYLAIVAPENAAVRQARSLTPAEVAPVITAARTANAALLRVAWPSNVLPDIKSLVSADGAVIGDLMALSSVTESGKGAWQAQYGTDTGKQQAAAQVVRADLGLPASGA